VIKWCRWPPNGNVFSEVWLWLVVFQSPGISRQPIRGNCKFMASACHVKEADGLTHAGGP